MISIESYAVWMDYGMSRSDMVRVGEYDWNNNNINETNFPIESSGKGYFDVKLVCFDRFTELGLVRFGLDLYDLRPGNLTELLGFGAAFKTRQLEFPIVEIGSLWPDVQRKADRGVYLRRGNKERGLSFIWVDRGFLPYYRFIAVKKTA